MNRFIDYLKWNNPVRQGFRMIVRYSLQDKHRIFMGWDDEDFGGKILKAVATNSFDGSSLDRKSVV